jgi:hypothetical protein
LSIEEIAPADERLPEVFEVMRELRTHVSLDGRGHTTAVGQWDEVRQRDGAGPGAYDRARA